MSGSGSPTINTRSRQNFTLNTPSTANPSRSHSPSNLTTIEPGAPQSTERSISARSRSILNLTSSTLYGIYGPFSGEKEDGGTPWGTRPVTPTGSRKSHVGRRSSSKRSRGSKRSSYVKAPPTATSSLVKYTVICGLGACYGQTISFLHTKGASLSVDPVEHLAVWAVFAATFAKLMPWFDRTWSGDEDDEDRADAARPKSSSGRWTMPEWIDVVRLVGGFIGISFAIRRLPWQSRLQQSATVALANPAVWYAIDSTLPGLLLSTVVAVCGSTLALSIRPDMPTPWRGPDAIHKRIGNLTLPELPFGSHVGGNASSVSLSGHETLALGIWLATVLFVMCTVFGNLGRRL